MRRTLKGSATVAAGIAALVALLPSGASGDPSARVVAETKVTISRFLPLYHGRVKSNFAECEDGRKVILYKVKPGDDKIVGKDHANDRGKWRIHAPSNLAPGDRFYAKVRNFDAGGTGTGLGCAHDKSPTVEFVGD